MPWKSRWKRKSGWVVQPVDGESCDPLKRTAARFNLAGKVMPPAEPMLEQPGKFSFFFWAIGVGIFAGALIAGCLLLRPL